MDTPWFTAEEVAHLLANARRWYGIEDAGGEDDPPFDPEPVALLHLPGTRCRWLVFGIDGESGDADDPILVVLADLGLGCVEHGTVFARELAEGAFGRPAVRDPTFRAQGPMSRYAAASRPGGRMVLDPVAVAGARGDA